MSDNKKPREFTNVALLAHNSTDLRISQRALEEVNGIRDAYAALAKENEELKVKLADFELDCKMSDDVIDHTEKEITSLRERLAEYENLPSGMRSAKLHVENESLRESLKLAVEALEKVDFNHEISSYLLIRQALATIKAKGEL